MLQHFQVIIHGKCQVRLAASEINDMHGSVGWQFRQNIFNKLQEAIDLSILVITCTDNLPAFCHNAQINHKRHCRSFFDDILLLAIMLQILCLNTDCFFALYCCLALLADKHRHHFILHPDLRLSEIMQYPSRQCLQSILRRHILMKNLLVRISGYLKIQTIPDHNRPYLYLYKVTAASCTANDHIYQKRCQHTLQ